MNNKEKLQSAFKQKFNSNPEHVMSKSRESIRRRQLRHNGPIYLRNGQKEPRAIFGLSQPRL